MKSRTVDSAEHLAQLVKSMPSVHRALASTPCVPPPPSIHSVRWHTAAVLASRKWRQEDWEIKDACASEASWVNRILFPKVGQGVAQWVKAGVCLSTHL